MERKLLGTTIKHNNNTQSLNLQNISINQNLNSKSKSDKFLG